jgi:hypothetical protein
MNMRTRFGIALLIGCLSGLFCAYILSRTRTGVGDFGAGDFGPALRTARDLLAGKDPYGYIPSPYNIPYPIPAALLAMPLTFLKDSVAGGVFFGLSSGTLAWLILSRGNPWQLFLFLSGPFFYASLFAQWSPLVLCLYFSSAFLSVLMMKPQIALPLVLTRRPGWLGISLAVVIGITSLVIYPTWPFVWLGQVSTYQGILPPLFVLPLGPLILFSLLRYRDQRAWLLVLMAIMPQRVLYDQLVLLLVAGNRREILILILCSWISLPALLIFGGWNNLPGGWHLWILLTLYFPALGVFLAPTLVAWVKQRMNSQPLPG